MSLDLPKIGQLLKQTRETRGLKLEDVSSALYLRKSIIDALESGDWERLPHPVYVKGYLNQYASYLNIENELSGITEMHDEPVDVPEAVIPKTVSDHGDQNRLSDRIRAMYPRKGLVFYGLGAVILAAFLAYQNIHVPYPTPVPAATYQTASSTVYEASAKSSERPTPSVLEPKKLVVACQERTWLRVVIDEAEKKEFMLNPEEMVAFNANDGFDVLIGNAGGVTLFYNGRNIGFEGRNGEVKRVRLP